jgi:hypothetical protein
MTIRGYFDPTDPMQKPRADGMIYFPRLQRARALTFKIDTGADATALC